MKQRLADHIKLTFYLCLLSAGAVALFLKDAPASAGVLPLLYQCSIAGYYGTLLVLVSVLLLPLSFFAWTRWLLPVLGWIWLVYLAIDLAVFNLYRFHLDWLMVQMFLLDFRGMGIPVFVLALAGTLALLMLGVVSWLYAASRSGSLRHLPLFIIGLLLMPTGLAANSVIHIWASYFTREEITSYRPYMPLYYPVEDRQSASRISAWWPVIFPAVQGQAMGVADKASGIVHYPLKSPACLPASNPPSILMIVLESWQADSLTPEIMPNLSKFATRATRFDKHLSSGAVTVPGLFGLMYGLHPNYFELFKTSPARYPSVFTETLHQQGYQTHVFTSSSLDGFSLRKLFFGRVPEAKLITDMSDEQVVTRYLSSMKSAINAPRFDFMFLTSSHSPYTYPPEYGRFKPLPAIKGAYAVDKHADNAVYKNDYHNSLFYSDALLGRVLDAAQKSGALDNSWVVITGDHAEEFNENGLGYWGHGSNFTRWQTQTPLLLMSPGQFVAKRESRLSLHQDIVPTLMQEALGCKEPANSYSSGINLFHLPERRGTLLASYMMQAYWVDDIVFDRTTNRSYDWRDMKQARTLENMEAVRALMNEERRFLSSEK
jgi:membrane-anchored protein YejM (alkaline phosphatase superfamily)